MSSDRTRDQAKKQIIGCNGFSEAAGTQFEQVLWDEYGTAPRNYRSKVTALRHWLLKPANAPLIEEINAGCNEQTVTMDVKQVVSAILENKAVNLALKSQSAIQQDLSQTAAHMMPASVMASDFPPATFPTTTISPPTASFDYNAAPGHTLNYRSGSISNDNVIISPESNLGGRSTAAMPPPSTLPLLDAPPPLLDAPPPLLSHGDQSSIQLENVSASAASVPESNVITPHMKADTGTQSWEFPAEGISNDQSYIAAVSAEEEKILVPGSVSQNDESIFAAQEAEVSNPNEQQQQQPLVIHEAANQLSINECDPIESKPGPSLPLEAAPSSVSPPAEELSSESQKQQTNFLSSTQPDSLDAATSVAILPPPHRDNTYAAYSHRPAQPLQITKQPDLAPPPPSNDPIRAPGASYNWNPPVSATQEESTEMKTKDAVTSIYKYKVVIPDTVRLLNEARESTLIQNHEQRKEAEIKGLERSIQKQFEKGRELTTMMIEIDGLVRSMTRTLSTAAEGWGTSTTMKQHPDTSGGGGHWIESGSTELSNALNQCYEEVRTFREELEIDATRAGVIQSVANISCIDRVKEAGADFLVDLENFVAAL